MDLGEVEKTVKKSQNEQNLNLKMSQKVNQDNWSYCGYQSSQYQALITLGAHPSTHPDQEEPQLIYFLTLLDGDFQAIFQQEFPTLEESLKALNQRYGHWAFSHRQGEGQGGQGCSSCQAH